MKVCPYCRESVASKKMKLHIESHYFQSDMFQPIVCLQNLSESEIQGLRTLELFKRLKIEDEEVITEEVQEVSEEPTRLTMEHFKSPMFQPTVRLSNLSKSEVQILQALELFRQFKRPFWFLNAFRKAIKGEKLKNFWIFIRKNFLSNHMITINLTGHCFHKIFQTTFRFQTFPITLLWFDGIFHISISRIKLALAIWFQVVYSKTKKWNLFLKSLIVGGCATILKL